jgi:hypothetical protein
MQVQHTYFGKEAGQETLTSSIALVVNDILRSGSWQIFKQTLASTHSMLLLS